ncbi:antibiotic biosynthesis monooxygenase [Arthrobacter sp. ISL-65]|nr:antibiotic biosynthesis monooxygenase [Arthrobacter sp. ISL-65]
MSIAPFAALNRNGKTMSAGGSQQPGPPHRDFQSEAGRVEKVEAALTKAVCEVDKEKGCIRYELTESRAERLILTEGTAPAFVDSGS